MLQLANSAVFGLELQVSQPLEAIAYIGLETTKALVLLAHTVSSFDRNQTGRLFRGRRSGGTRSSTGQIAQKIALMEKGGLEAAEQAFAAGLLHDLGKLILCANLPGTLCQGGWRWRARKNAISGTRKRGSSPTPATRNWGAVILGIWGLPQPIARRWRCIIVPGDWRVAGFPPADGCPCRQHSGSRDESRHYGDSALAHRSGLSGGIGTGASRGTMAAGVRVQDRIGAGELKLGIGEWGLRFGDSWARGRRNHTWRPACLP